MQRLAEGDEGLDGGFLVGRRKEREQVRKRTREM